MTSDEVVAVCIFVTQMNFHHTSTKPEEDITSQSRLIINQNFTLTQGLTFRTKNSYIFIN